MAALARRTPSNNVERSSGLYVHRACAGLHLTRDWQKIIIIQTHSLSALL